MPDRSHGFQLAARRLSAGAGLAQHPLHWRHVKLARPHSSHAHLPNDAEDFYAPIPSPLQGRGKAGAQRQQGEGATSSNLPLPLDGGGRVGVPSPSSEGNQQIRPCALCALPIAPATLVRLRVQKPTGPVKRPEFDEQSLPVHFDCLAAVSTSRPS